MFAIVYMGRGEMCALRDLLGHSNSKLFRFYDAVDNRFSKRSDEGVFGYCNLSCSFRPCINKFYALKSWMPNPIFILRPLRLIHPASPRGSVIAGSMTDGSGQKENQFSIIELKNSSFYACSPNWHVHPSNPLYKIARVQRIISEHYCVRYSLADLAKRVEWCATWLSCSFKKYTGFTLEEYLAKIRFCFALWRLVTTNAPIKAIASEVGYGDALYFSKTFKKRFGYSPKMARVYPAGHKYVMGTLNKTP